ncbi:HdeA/HdeB family chaperone [Providencia stuartii]|uniref:Uncharacterized protein n=1 Tax=Providencia stuartii ATCC 25827 TaxID=471874 RepID=A0AA86YF85_PROST|nr:HdeA/HdeB family chaperone [Providencia stuartii]EDU57730.1 hypothetical protein PROSTU_04354 [Providencia stuartii ATCC 25827]EDU60928.1 hypothetical protein PROSTU_00909 [Providencia stuartii ATCC 25827]EDU61315.1 hypothetical protein PROSTU_00671 [Providencia stuartii ATCC 25827]MCX3072498.1 HdeA/HdeB family chaperone [Providencia stuartii]
MTQICVTPVSQWKCEDFLVIDDNFYPTAIGAAEIVTQKGKVEVCRGKGK